MREIKALLIDLDGVIYNDSERIPGSDKAIRWLQKRKIPFRFITNTTMKSRATLQKKLADFGIKVPESSIFSAAHAAAEYIRRSGKHNCHLLLTDDAKQDYSGLNTNSDKPNWVVAGDLGDNMTFNKLNTAFQKLFAGAEMIALQKNRYWMSDRGITLDAGAFVALLEFASGKNSILIGKPSKTFYETVLNDLGFPPEDVAMIGDDIESDIKGAEASGINTVLVKTGKFRPQDLQRKDVSPWKLLDSISEIHKLF